MAFFEGYVQVADDGAGKRVRNKVVDVLQPDGTTLVVYQQVVTRAFDDGTLLDTRAFVETERDKYMRALTEQMVVLLTTLAGSPLPGMPGDPLSVPLGEMP